MPASVPASTGWFVLNYSVDATAARYNASSPEETQDGTIAYARFRRRRRPATPADCFRANDRRNRFAAGGVGDKRGSSTARSVMRVLNRILLLVAALGVSLVLAGSASAKGPIAATITGPGLASPLKLSYRSIESRDAMAKLTEDGDFFRQAFTSMPGRSPARRPPAGALGPRYLVVYTVPGPNGNSRLRQHLYPYAVAGAVTFMPRGQRFWDTRRTRGGWSRGSRALAEALVEAGLPAQP